METQRDREREKDEVDRDRIRECMDRQIERGRERGSWRKVEMEE